MSHYRTRTVLAAAHDAPWRDMPLETLFAIWHLQRGGLLFSQIGDRLGLDPRTVEGAAGAIELMLTGPIPVPKNVRCCGCGGMLAQIPCRICGWKTEKYRVPRESALVNHETIHPAT